jgi:hypothetical protein
MCYSAFVTAIDEHVAPQPYFDSLVHGVIIKLISIGRACRATPWPLHIVKNQ